MESGFVFPYCNYSHILASYNKGRLVYCTGVFCLFGTCVCAYMAANLSSYIASELDEYTTIIAEDNNLEIYFI